MEFCTTEEVEDMVLQEWADKEVPVSRVEERAENSSSSASDDETDRGSSITSHVTYTPIISSSPVTQSLSQPRSDPLHTRERARKAARRLTEEKIISIWQMGKIVDPSFAKGVMELRGLEGLDVDLVLVRHKMLQKKAKLAALDDAEESDSDNGKKKKKKGKGKKDWKEVEEELDEIGNNGSGGKGNKGKKGNTRR